MNLWDSLVKAFCLQVEVVLLAVIYVLVMQKLKDIVKCFVGHLDNQRLLPDYLHLLALTRIFLVASPLLIL